MASTVSGTPPHIGAILQGTSQTLEALFGQSPTLGKLQMHPAATTTDAEVNVLVGFTGGVSGQILIGIDVAEALAMASLLMMSEVTAFDEITRSALAEVGNMIAGNCATQLHTQGIESNITVPTIIQGQQVRVSWPNLYLQKTTIQVPFGAIHLAIGLKITRDGAEGGAS